MTKVLIPSSGPNSWQQFLAQPSKQWVTGYSAKTIAHSWEAQPGWPPEIASMVEGVLGSTQMLLAIPEHKTPLPGGNRESQSDVFVLGRHTGGLVACTIEGKVNEAFGPTVAEQMKNASPGKHERLDYLCRSLGLVSCPDDIHYQLLHRTVSALIEADRFATNDAAMIVHSFSHENRWFDAFEKFANLLGATVGLNEPAVLTMKSGTRLILGWACGDPRHLQA